MNPLVALILAIVIISAVVGVIAQFLNKLNEVNAPPVRRPPPRPGARPGQLDPEMDRFLAEIERLRKKNAQPAEAAANDDSRRAAPVAKPVRAPDKARPRLVAELAEPAPPPQQPPRLRDRVVDDHGFVVPTSTATPPVSATESPRPKPGELPVATVVDTSGISAQVSSPPALAAIRRVSDLPTSRTRPTPKTDLARQLTSLLNTKQGLAAAVILQEVLGPPRCKR